MLLLDKNFYMSSGRDIIIKPDKQHKKYVDRLVEYCVMKNGRPVINPKEVAQLPLDCMLPHPITGKPCPETTRYLRELGWWATYMEGDEANRKVIEQHFWEQTKDRFWEKPVDINTFIDDPEFLGNIYGKQMNKWWRHILNKIYPSTFQKVYCEVIASLAIGTGKTTAASISLAYEMYKLMCMKDPIKYYERLVTGTKIVFSLFNVSKDLAYSVTFEPLKTILAESPYFKDKVKIPGKSSLLEFGIYVTDDIRIDIGSLDRNALGKAVFGAVMDEGNFNRVEDQTLKTYSTLRTRIQSRFGTTYGFPGVLWTVSSPITNLDSINILIGKADPRTTLVLDDVAQWEVWPDPSRFTLDKRFPVYIGDNSNDPRIISGGTKQIEQEKWDKNRIIWVPNNLYKLFKHDIYKNVRDLGGRRVAGSMNLFRSVEQLRNVFTAPLPFTSSDPIKLDFYEDKDTLQKYANVNYFRNPLNPECPRFIHLDLAFAEGINRFGIAATYSKSIDSEIVPYKRKTDPLDEDQDEVEMSNRFYYVDWAIAIEAKENQKIPLRKVREFLIWLRDYCNYPIELITGDKPSEAFRNDLESDSFICKYLTVDKDRTPWLSIRDQVESQNIIGPRNNLIIKEFINLIDDSDKEKIDHPQTNPDQSVGTKDIADAITGSYWACKTHKYKDGKLLIDNSINSSTKYTRRLIQIKNQHKDNPEINPEALLNFIKN